MRPTLHGRLINGRFGDPALFVSALHARDAILFDAGDLSSLSARDLLRVRRLFVSHMHMDHWIGFDALLRVNVGREARIDVAGPPGIIDAVAHKLAAYTWDLAGRYETDLVWTVTEWHGGPRLARARFRFLQGFAREELESAPADGGVLARTADWTVTAALLEHHGPCLGFLLAEPCHVNVWRNRVKARGLPLGPWLNGLKAAVRDGRGDDWPVPLPHGETAPLGSLRDVVSTEPGQRLGYVTDVADTPSNCAAIARLCAGADTLFIEARFAAADAALAAARAHLTTAAAGAIARAAAARRVEPFHFSPRYEGAEDAMLREVATAFARA